MLLCFLWFYLTNDYFNLRSYFLHKFLSMQNFVCVCVGFKFIYSIVSFVSKVFNTNLSSFLMNEYENEILNSKPKYEENTILFLV